MRVISGSARGRRLKRVPGDTTRPIMDRVKENLFNILSQMVEGSRWLDLFAGTGQVGIEALSRGAECVVFVDNAIAAIRTIKANLEHTGLLARAEVVHADAFAFLRMFSGQQFDLIFLAPPQYKELWSQALVKVDARPALYLTTEGIVVIQIDPKEYREVELVNLALADRRRYGNTLLGFFEQM